MTTEEEMNCWRAVEGYEGYYEVSILGQVRSLDRIDARGNRLNGKVLSLGQNNKGYPQVILSKNRKREGRLVHRIVAKAFPKICGTWFDGCEIDHLDRDKQNNNAHNLRVGTHQQNMNNPGTRKASSEAHRESWKDPVKSKKLREGHKKAGIKHKKEIVQLSLTGELVGIWDSATDAGRELGFFKTSISACCLGKMKTAYGFKWMFINDYLEQRFGFKIKCKVA